MTKKYLFPFEKEKRVYPWKELLIFLSGCYAMIIIICLSTLKTSEEESKKTIIEFFQSSPDLIVVPTGDYGRLP